MKTQTFKKLNILKKILFVLFISFFEGGCFSAVYRIKGPEGFQKVWAAARIHF